MARKLKCDDCGELDHVLFDGYAFGDRMLEGVMFQARLEGEEDFVVVFAPGNEHYTKKLNTDYWLAAAKVHAAELDIAVCPKCNDDVAMPGFEDEDDDEA